MEELRSNLRKSRFNYRFEKRGMGDLKEKLKLEYGFDYDRMREFCVGKVKKPHATTIGKFLHFIRENL